MWAVDVPHIRHGTVSLRRSRETEAVLFWCQKARTETHLHLIDYLQPTTRLAMVCAPSANDGPIFEGYFDSALITSSNSAVRSAERWASSTRACILS